jgi:outer membrane protein TolC
VSADSVKNQETVDDVEKGRALDVAALGSHASLLDAQQAELTEKLHLDDLTRSLNDLLGLPLTAQLILDPDTAGVELSIPGLADCIKLSQEQSPAIRSAQQAVLKARAGLRAARDAYIPDVTALARYSYQSGVPLLVHNFGTFGFTLSYDIFDGGRRNAEIKDATALLTEAQVNLDKVQDEVSVEVQSAYDKITQIQKLVNVADEALTVRTEFARLADRQFEQDAALASARAEAHAKVSSAKASLMEAKLGLSLAEADLKRAIGQLPR